MCSGLDTVPTDRKVIKYSVHPTMHLATASVSSANACLPSSATRLSIVSSVIFFFFFFFLSVYGIKAASKSDLLIRSTQLKLTCRSLAVYTRWKIWIYKYAGYQNKNGEKR